jgi:hypothetical protein
MVPFCVTPHPGYFRWGVWPRLAQAIKHVQRERVYIVRSERKFSFYSKKWMDTAGQISVLSLHKLPVYYALRFICNE